MPATLTAPANDILNRVAAEVGLDPVDNPWDSQLQHFVQMRYLLNIAGEELCQLYQWEELNREHSIVTASGDSGDYDLPSDFLYMINQTGWERSENVPLFGPLSAQDWQWLLGRDLVSYTIYASFRIKEGKFSIFPQPPPENLDIHFEYVSRNWVWDPGLKFNYADRIVNGSAWPLFDRTLVSRYLKVKYLEAKSLDTTKAQADLDQIFGLLTGHDKGAEVLSAGRNGRSFPYLNGFTSVPDTGYGM